MQRLKSLREEHNLTLRQLSEKLNISYSSLGKYERAEQQPSFDTLIKIAKFFGVSTDYLLGCSNYKNAAEEYGFSQSLSLPRNKVLYDLFQSILKNYSRLVEQYKKCNISFTSHDIPAQMLTNLNVIVKAYEEIAPAEAESLEELAEQAGQMTSSITLNFETYQLFTEMLKLYTHQPPTTR